MAQVIVSPETYYNCSVSGLVHEPLCVCFYIDLCRIIYVHIFEYHTEMRFIDVEAALSSIRYETLEKWIKKRKFWNHLSTLFKFNVLQYLLYAHTSGTSDYNHTHTHTHTLICPETNVRIGLKHWTKFRANNNIGSFPNDEVIYVSNIHLFSACWKAGEWDCSKYSRKREKWLTGTKTLLIT